MTENNIKDALVKAQDAVKDIKDEALRVKAFELVFNQLTQNRASSDPTNVVVNSRVKTMSIKEFLLQHTVKSETEKALVFGYFLEKYKQFDSFTMADLKQCYFEAKEVIPPNVSDKIFMNISRGLFMEAPEKKGGKRSIVLTASGEEYVLTKLSKNKVA